MTKESHEELEFIQKILKKGLENFNNHDFYEMKKICLSPIKIEILRYQLYYRNLEEEKPQDNNVNTSNLNVALLREELEALQFQQEVYWSGDITEEIIARWKTRFRFIRNSQL